MWRMAICIRHICGEHKNILGHRCPRTCSYTKMRNCTYFYTLHFTQTCWANFTILLEQFFLGNFSEAFVVHIFWAQFYFNTAIVPYVATNLLLNFSANVSHLKWSLFPMCHLGGEIDGMDKFWTDKIYTVITLLGNMFSEIFRKKLSV